MKKENNKGWEEYRRKLKLIDQGFLTKKEKIFLSILLIMLLGIGASYILNPESWNLWVYYFIIFLVVLVMIWLWKKEKEWMEKTSSLK